MEPTAADIDATDNLKLHSKVSFANNKTLLEYDHSFYDNLGFSAEERQIFQKNCKAYAD